VKWTHNLAAPVFKACSWAVGTFCFTSIASYEYCLYRRRTERRNLKRVVEVLDQKRTEKETEQARIKAERGERERVNPEAAKQTQEPKRSSWRFW
jgi:cytochrome c oxidase assembly protein subunit 20